MKTVFVVGAGASKEANLPIGSELKLQISELLDIRFDRHQISGDRLIYSSIWEYVKKQGGKRDDTKEYVQSAWHIRDALPLAISIDNFIDSQRGLEKIEICGKLAIVRSILKAERDSKLYVDKYSENNKLDYRKLQDTWYVSFFKLLTENCQVTDLKERLSSIVLIIFNYDRCIEQFLLHSIKEYYRLTFNEAADLMSCLEVYHPYGSVGDLPHLNENNPIDFGAELDALQLLDLIKRIKTFTEGTDPSSSDIEKISNHICKSGKIVFLGFAFHKLNMDLISSTNCNRQGTMPKCYATTYEISESDEKIVRKKIVSLYKNQMTPNMSNMTCYQFFNHYWRSLAF